MSYINLCRISFRVRASRLAGYGLFVMIGLSAGRMPLRADDAVSEGLRSQSESRVLPEPVTEESFSALKTNSPFLRSVGLSDAIVLTGIAHIGNDVFATLFDTDTAESHIVSTTANSLGWQLVDVRGDEADLESLTAKIQLAGGEVISIRYEKFDTRAVKGKSGSNGGGSGVGSRRLSSEQFKQAREAAVNFRGEHPADGFPRLPPPEVVQKLSKMSVQQREGIAREMIELRNRGLGMQERSRIYVDKIDRTLRGGR